MALIFNLNLKILMIKLQSNEINETTYGSGKIWFHQETANIHSLYYKVYYSIPKRHTQ